MNSILSTSPLRWPVSVPDVLILLSCASGTLALLLFSRRHRARPAYALYIALAVLLASIGIAHIIASMRPLSDTPALQWLAIITAIAALIASQALWPLLKRSSQDPLLTTRQLTATVEQLEHEVAERKRAELQLKQSEELLRQLAAYQERVKEDERKRIAREIHDELGQNLMALRIDISMLQARTASSHPLLHQKASQVLLHIDEAIKSVRTIINNLRPSVLDLGLNAALEWQVSEFERRTGISCDLIIDAQDASAYDLDDQRATALFRILQESLSNVARHAQASMVSIRLQRQGEYLVMKIADNGVGIYPGCRRKPNSFGLLGIGERISSLGGEFNVDSVPGQGTTLTVSIPFLKTDQLTDTPVTT